MTEYATELLNARLKAVHDMAVSGLSGLQDRRLIDVGSDHGHLSIYSLINDGFSYAILTDIHDGPARRSEEAMRMYGFADKSSVYCTDGLDGVELQEGDVIVMAGLGGNNMIDILRRVVTVADPAVLRSIVWCLQPQKSSDKLREFLAETGFAIIDENACEDRGIYYLIVKAVFTGEPYKLSLTEKFYGPVILKREAASEPIVLKYVERLDGRFELSQRGDEEIRKMLTERRDDHEQN
ncbi:MAG: SAM-dependent methyltransferase [Clostridiales bacterium]|nr:SAM-dependent methyltransferase [Clostridiales bacterium]